MTTLLDIVKHLQGKHPQSSHAPKSGKTAPKIDVRRAIMNYTQLVDYDKSDVKRVMGTREYEKFERNTQDYLKSIGKETLSGIHLTQNIDADPDKINQVIELNDVFSLSEGKGPREFRDYKYELVVTGIPVQKIMAHSKATPDLFPLKSEDEFITKGMKIRINQFPTDPADKKIYAKWVPNDTPTGGGVDRTDPDWWKAFLVE